MTMKIDILWVSVIIYSLEPDYYISHNLLSTLIFFLQQFSIIFAFAFDCYSSCFLQMCFHSKMNLLLCFFYMAYLLLEAYQFSKHFIICFNVESTNSSSFVLVVYLRYSFRFFTISILLVFILFFLLLFF
jgi:hypothetical protein